MNEKTGIKSITFVTVPGKREDGVVPKPPRDWDKIDQLSRGRLRALGCRPWSGPDKDGNVLMIVDIFGKTELFQPGVTDDDMRMGCLAYGILVPA